MRLVIIFGLFLLIFAHGSYVVLAQDFFFFPTLRIYVEGGRSPFLERNERNRMHLSFDSYNNPEQNLEKVTGVVRGRGHSTWRQTETKRPLRFHLDTPHSLAGSEYEATNWILLANHFDRSLMRTFLAFDLSRSLGRFPWTASEQFVHLYVNGAYEGVYQLVDERDLYPGRIVIMVDNDPSLSEFIIELSSSAIGGGNVENRDYWRVNSHPDGVSGRHWSGAGIDRDGIYSIRYPSDPSDEHVEYMRYFVTNVGRTIRSHDWEAIQQVVHVDQLVDMFLLNEFHRCPDQGVRSFFQDITGQGDERRLGIPFLWDFDLAFGNRGRSDAIHDSMAIRAHYWFYHLWQVPEFRTLARIRWQEDMEQIVLDVLGRMNTYATNYEAEFMRNWERFQLLGKEEPLFTSQNHPVFLLPSWSAQIAYLNFYFEQRLIIVRRTLSEHVVEDGDGWFTAVSQDTPLVAITDYNLPLLLESIAWRVE